MKRNRRIVNIAVLLCLLVSLFAFTACVTDEHVHDFANGVCNECGEVDATFKPVHTEHIYVDGKCECGEIDIFYIKSAAISYIQEYANDAQIDIIKKYSLMIEQVVADEILLMNKITDYAEFEIEKQIACYKIDLVMLLNNRDVAIDVAVKECDPNISYYASLINEISESGIYMGSKQQYEKEVSNLKQTMIDASVKCDREKRLLYEKYASMGLAGSGALQWAIQNAEKERDAIKSEASKRKNELMRLWANKELYSDYMVKYNSWVDYKTYYLQDIESWYDISKEKIDESISNLVRGIN